MSHFVFEPALPECGKWVAGAGKHAWWGVKEGSIDPVSIAEVVPADARAAVENVKAGMKDGSFSIWKGPLLAQDGKEWLKPDEVADDKALSGINFYIKGVAGKLPDGK